MTFLKGFASGAVAASMACMVYIYNSAGKNYGSKSNRKWFEEERQRRSGNTWQNYPALEDVKQLEKQREILKFGVPDRGLEMRVYEDHILGYDQARKIPVWVAEHMTQDKLKGKAHRKHSHFKPDPLLNKKFSSKNEDYWKSGWSRGHMAPAGNYKYDQHAMDETFYLTNVVPQDKENNSGFWNRFEIYCRDLTKKFKDVWIISGPVFLPNLEDSDERPFMKYQLIGKSHVAVPTHLYKVIVVKSDDKNNDISIAAFIVPNKPLDNKQHLTDFLVPIDTLEEKTGVTFLPKLDQSRTRNLCDVESCKLKSHNEIELFFLKKRVESAKDIDQLQNVYNDIKEKRLKPDQDFIKLYKIKESQLNDNLKVKREL